jgi:hypothetical protein
MKQLFDMGSFSYDTRDGVFTVQYGVNRAAYLSEYTLNNNVTTHTALLLVPRCRTRYICQFR